jgi:hypothetical protein
MHIKDQHSRIGSYVCARKLGCTLSKVWFALDPSNVPKISDIRSNYMQSECTYNVFFEGSYCLIVMRFSFANLYPPVP